MKTSCHENNTPRVPCQHHMLTLNVLNAVTMRTVGERIRQAREYRGMTAEALAREVGYKTQSGISNLENRATGHGGYRITRIAEVLDVSLEWLLNGPDTDDMSQVPPFRRLPELDSRSLVVREEVSTRYQTARERCHTIIDALPEAGVLKALDLLLLVEGSYGLWDTERAGYSVPARKNAA